jgi:drug/metabolite transporter (DMT)-like permease
MMNISKGVMVVDKKTAGTLAAVLGAIGLLFILAGPAFHFIQTDVGIFLALASWIVGGLIKALAKEAKKKKKK